MSQQPFSRPGAVDLSALKRPAAPAPSGGPAPAAGSGAYSVVLDERNIQAELEASMTAPVLLVVYSPTTAPASAQMAADLTRLNRLRVGGGRPG